MQPVVMYKLPDRPNSNAGKKMDSFYFSSFFHSGVLNCTFFINWILFLLFISVHLGVLSWIFFFFFAQKPFEVESVIKASFIEKKMQPVVMCKPPDRPNSSADKKINMIWTVFFFSIWVASFFYFGVLSCTFLKKLFFLCRNLEETWEGCFVGSLQALNTQCQALCHRAGSV